MLEIGISAMRWREPSVVWFALSGDVPTTAKIVDTDSGAATEFNPAVEMGSLPVDEDATELHIAISVHGTTRAATVRFDPEPEPELSPPVIKRRTRLRSVK